ncbi:MAG: T9SS type A sorting domain-containing protein [Saprospiraceae bacterium]|nr:T9SS type A sorting domain-containing protein [Saprospiraceae bacterium]
MTPFNHLISTIILSVSCICVFAQPPNDYCSGAIHLDIATSEVTSIKVDGDTRNTIDELPANIPSCSGNFYRDAVWYKFVTPDTMPLYGMSVKIYYGTEPDDVDSPGIALYESCDGSPNNPPIYCENAPEGDRMNLGQFCPELTPGTTYYIRVWSNKGSSADWTEGWGTFRIAAFFNTPVATDPQIIWNKGVFNQGLDGWTTKGVLCSNDINGNAVDGSNALWEWGFNSFCALWLGPWLQSPTECNGAAYFDSGWYDSYGFIDSAGLGPCPAIQEGLLISPMIDLTDVSVSGISVSFYQLTKQFNNQYFLEYRMDDSPVWQVIDLFPGVVAYDPNMPTPFDPDIKGETIVDLPGAELADSIQIRFRFKATYYYWAIDDVRLIETPCCELVAQPGMARAANAVWHKRALHDFPAGLEVTNTGDCPAEHVSVQLDIIHESGQNIYSVTTEKMSLSAQSLPTLFQFENCVDLSGSPLGNYEGRYTILSEQPESNSANNVTHFKFQISDYQLAKEIPGMGYLSGFHPVGPNGSVDFGVANYYYLPDAGGLAACEVEVGIANADELTPETLGYQAGFQVWLYTWQDLNEDHHCQLEEEAEWVGLSEYQFQNGDQENSVFTLPVVDINYENCVWLESQTNYLLAFRYHEPLGIPKGEAPLFLLRNPGFSYALNQWITAPLPGFGMCIPSFGSFVDAGLQGQEYKNEDFNSLGAPVIRMNIEDISSVGDWHPEVPIYRLKSNPASDRVVIEWGMEVGQEEFSVSLFSIEGQLMMQAVIQPVSQGTSELAINQLPFGVYFLTVKNGWKVQTEKVIISH